MSLFTTFRSPAWEQRDPQRRAAAVRDETAPELLAKLPQIAAGDDEPAVRRAALMRIADVALLLERQRTDSDPATRAAAATRLSKLLLDPAAGLALDARCAALPQLPTDLVERIAESAPETQLRRAALQRITRAGFLQRRAVDDPDATLREEALSRIEGEEALERLAEALRKRDKQLARRARERVQALRLARGDHATLQQYGMQLCDELALWAQRLPQDVEARLAQAMEVFDARRAQLDDAMQRRVEAYVDRVRAALARRETRAAEPPPVLAPEIPVAAPEPARPAFDFSEFDAAIKATERALQAQKLGDARPAFEQAVALAKKLPRAERARRERLGKAQEKIDELEQWQRWSGNRVRARLCEDVQALMVAGHHPDAVANRVRELQAEWAKVEAAEPGDADRTSGLARRFRALCGKAMAPTKAYFEQRHALREQRRVACEALLAGATESQLPALSAPALGELRRKLTEGLRGLDDLEPKVRSALARRLREALTRIDAALDAQREEAALVRRKLIARLRRELTHADPVVALEMAREAQQEWKTLPRAGREAEPLLEQELKALLDPLFAREREARERSTAETTRVETESRRLLAEIEALSHSDAEALAHAEGRIAALQAQWRELHATVQAAAESGLPRRAARTGFGDARGRGNDSRGPRVATSGPSADARGASSRVGASTSTARGANDSRGRPGDRRDGPRDRNADPRRPRPADVDRPFDQAVARVRQAQGTLEAARRGTRLQAIAQAAALFARIAHGSSDKSEAAWQAIELDEADRRRLQPCWQAAARENESALLANDDAVERWLVQAELDASLESPANAQALRRECQMQRLAVRLQGARADATDARERLLQFALLPPASAPEQAERERRLQRVLEVWSR